VCPPGTKGGEHSPAGEGVGDKGNPNSDDWRNCLAFCLLCVLNAGKKYVTTTFEDIAVVFVMLL